MLVLFKQVSIALSSFSRCLASIVIVPGHTKCIFLNNQQCMTQPTLINLHPNKYSGSCNTLNDLSNRVFVPNKAEDLDLNVFNMIKGINELKTLTKRNHANVSVSLTVVNIT